METTSNNDESQCVQASGRSTPSSVAFVSSTIVVENASSDKDANYKDLDEDASANVDVLFD